jgi:ATP-binding cassette subfamily B protein
MKNLIFKNYGNIFLIITIDVLYAILLVNLFSVFNETLDKMINDLEFNILLILASIIITIISLILLKFFQNILTINFSNKISLLLTSIYSKNNIMTSNYNFNFGVSESISKLTFDIDFLIIKYVKPFLDIISSIIVSFLIFVMVSKFSILVTLYLAFLSLFTLLLPIYLGDKMTLLSNKMSILNKKYIEDTKNFLSGYEISFFSNSLEYIDTHINSIRVENEEKKKKIGLRFAFPLAVSNHLKIIVIFLSYVILIILFYFGKISTNELVVMFPITLLLYDEVEQICNSFIDIFSTKELFNDFINLEELNQNEINDTSVKKSETKLIEMNNFTFINDGDEMFEKINLTIHLNQNVFIQGDSGIGKSTLMKKMLSMESVLESTGEFNTNIDINDTFFKKKLAVINSEAIIFEDSFTNNITMGKKLNKMKLKKIIKICKLENLVYKNDNYNTYSKGESQRINLARMLYANKNILFLDEAFSSLDFDTEKNILEYLLSDPLYTIIIISHSNLEEKFCFDEHVILRKEYNDI